MAFLNSDQDAKRERQRFRFMNLPPGARAAVERERRAAEDNRRAVQANQANQANHAAWDEELDADEEGEEWSDSDPQEELLDTLKSIEHHREQLHQAASYFEAILATEPGLRTLWDQFTRAGGVTVDDLRCFLAGRFRYRRIRKHRHVRLVVNQKRKPMVIRRSHGGDHAA